MTSAQHLARATMLHELATKLQERALLNAMAKWRDSGRHALSGVRRCQKWARQHMKAAVDAYDYEGAEFVEHTAWCDRFDRCHAARERQRLVICVAA